MLVFFALEGTYNVPKRNRKSTVLISLFFDFLICTFTRYPDMMYLVFSLIMF